MARAHTEHDAIIIGAGHNGLVAAFYLASAGLRTLVLERRGIVGGACVTEEFHPGFRASPGAYVLSAIRPAVWRDLRLAERGIEPTALSTHHATLEDVFMALTGRRLRDG